MLLDIIFYSKSTFLVLLLTSTVCCKTHSLSLAFKGQFVFRLVVISRIHSWHSLNMLQQQITSFQLFDSRTRLLNYWRESVSENIEINFINYLFMNENWECVYLLFIGHWWRFITLWGSLLWTHELMVQVTMWKNHFAKNIITLKCFNLTANLSKKLKDVFTGQKQHVFASWRFSKTTFCCQTFFVDFSRLRTN